MLPCTARGAKRGVLERGVWPLVLYSAGLPPAREARGSAAREREWQAQELSRLWGRIVVVNLARAADFHSQRVYLHSYSLPHLLFSASETRPIKITRPFHSPSGCWAQSWDGRRSCYPPPPFRFPLAAFWLSVVVAARGVGVSLFLTLNYITRHCT